MSEQDPFQAEYRELWDATVQNLTTAARMKHEQYGQLDFADFLASAVAAVAANVGGAGRVLAGRSGSWEAGLVASMINGTVGEDDTAELHRRRTEPVVVPLNVAEAVERTLASGVQSPYDQEIEAINSRYATVMIPLPDGITPLTNAEADELDAIDDAQDQAVERWKIAYERYAARFTAAVERAAADTAGLAVPVSVVGCAAPDGAWEEPLNPSGYDGDPLVWQLWKAAFDQVPLPSLEAS